jgi:hypothetical protein
VRVDALRVQMGTFLQRGTRPHAALRTRRRMQRLATRGETLDTSGALGARARLVLGARAYCAWAGTTVSRALVERNESKMLFRNKILRF